MNNNTITVNRQGVEFSVINNGVHPAFWDINSWEEVNYKIIKEYSTRCPAFFNAGGWIGPFTLFAAKLFNKVYSLEPDPIAFSELKRNIELNNFTNVQLGTAALFNDSKTEITIGSDFGPLGGSGTSIFQPDKSITVSCTTLRKYFESNNIPAGSFLLLDVEGAEYTLFDDTSFFEIYKPVVLVEIHAKFMSDDNINQLLNGLNRINPIYHIGQPNIDRFKISHRLFIPR